MDVPLKEYIEKNISALKDYFESRIKNFENSLTALKEYFETKIQAVEKAIEVAYIALNKRLDNMNEFRSSLEDQTEGFVRREELEAKLNGMIAQIENLEKDNRIDLGELRSQIKSLEISKATLEGKASQSQTNFALIMSLVGLALAIIGMFVK